jgi:hypothetical protein
LSKTKIRILRDESFPPLMVALGAHNEDVARIMRDNYIEPIEPGTIVNATIDERGKARYAHPEAGTVWYSAQGDYEVILNG